MLNKHFIIIGLAFTLLLAGSKDIFSTYNFEEALSVGKTEGKGVLVKFHADWCHFCKKMDRETFTDQYVQKAMEDYISVKVNVDSKEGMALARKFGVAGLPTIIMFDKNGKRVYYKPGFHSAKQLKEVLSGKNG